MTRTAKKQRPARSLLVRTLVLIESDIAMGIIGLGLFAIMLAGVR